MKTYKINTKLKSNSTSFVKDWIVKDFDKANKKMVLYSEIYDLYRTYTFKYNGWRFKFEKVYYKGKYSPVVKFY